MCVVDQLPYGIVIAWSVFRVQLLVQLAEYEEPKMAPM